MRITMILLILNSHSIQGHEGRRRERNQVAAVAKKMIMEVIKKWRVRLLAGYLFLCFRLLLRGPVLVVTVKF
jgi:hypothetical protein